MTLPRHTGGSEGGYTLVELLIVLALLGVLSLLLVSGLQFGARAWDTGERQSLTLREIAITQARLRRFIGEAYPYFSTADPAHPRIAFDGGTHELTLIAVDPAASDAGRSIITIAQGDAGGRTALILRTRPELAPETTGAQDEAVIKGIGELTFAYLAEDATAWRADWREQKRMPRLVRVSVSFPDGDRRRWPDLVIAPRVTADVACVFDGLTKSCRGR